MHNGYTFCCSRYRCDARFVAAIAHTERTAIAHARAEGWFVGAVRITSGIPRSKRETRKLQLCPGCRGLVGA